MPRFALLPRESSNRVYADAAPALLGAELLAVAGAMHAEVASVAEQSFGAVPYVVFDAEALDDHDRFLTSNLSTVRAVFEVRADGAFLPIAIQPLEYFGSDLITIQRYPGKTNEQFTHLLVNLTVAASRAAADRVAEGAQVRVFDPVAGRGTTLNRALMYGYDATGIEVVEGDVDQYRTFITSYLKDHRIKHRVTSEKIRKGPLAGTSQFAVAIRGRQEVRLVRGAAAQSAALLAGRKFDAVVGDLPYGVQHRAAASKTSNRSPEELLDESLAGWRGLMRPGAAIGLSWNLLTMKRAVLVDVLEQAGFTVVEHPRSFEHVVDRSITRDLIVATR
ncbi:MAG: hypothetical protein WBP59_16310 [Ilumatobacteraceae bacterium]